MIIDSFVAVNEFVNENDLSFSYFNSKLSKNAIFGIFEYNFMNMIEQFYLWINFQRYKIYKN